MTRITYSAQFHSEAFVISQRFLFLVTVSVVWCSIQNAGAVDFMSLRSKHVGDGWFEYRLTVHDDPFFARFKTASFAVINFSNRTEYGMVSGVPSEIIQFFTNQNNGALWEFNPNFTNTLPHEITFRVRSSESSFRLNGHAAIVLFGFTARDLFTGNESAMGLVGFLKLNSIGACSVDQADGSAPEFLDSFSMKPDVAISEIFAVDGEARGLRYIWPEPSTVRFDGSSNLVNWTAITNIWGNPGISSWTSNVPLSLFGNYYRLVLMAESHVGSTSLVSSENTSNLSVAKSGVELSAAAIVVDWRIEGRALVGEFSSTIGQNYRIEVRDRDGRLTLSRNVQSTASVFKVSVGIEELPDSGRVFVFDQ